MISVRIDSEKEIQDSGNLHVIIEKMRALKKKQRKLVVDILINKRRGALRSLMKHMRMALLTESLQLTLYTSHQNFSLSLGTSMLI